MKLLVPSCNAYRATWEPFKAFLNHSWPDCPYELTICSEGDGEDKGWCSNLLSYLPDEEFVLMVLDDHWIDGEVIKSEIQWAERHAHRNGCVRLHPSPGLNINTVWGEHPLGKSYRCSTAPSIWQVSYLRSILEDVINCGFQSAQHFEILGTMATRFRQERILAPREGFAPLPFINSAIVRGKWCRRAIERAAEIGVTVDTSGREIA